ncbi:MAG TPA: aminoacyl-tRNA hydrolase [Bacteroidetes bacterium]|nr:aminoacyl-tRNA hydrolase [Bacteroidota bacterium]
MEYSSIHNRDFSTEFTFSASRSGGAGGQNVNKVNTKVELRFSIVNSQILSDEEKTLLMIKLASKLTTDGELIIVSQVERSQLANKEHSVEKFYKTIANALKPKKKRLPTKPTKASKEKRLTQKKSLSVKKELRKKPTS